MGVFTEQSDLAQSRHVLDNIRLNYKMSRKNLKSSDMKCFVFLSSQPRKWCLPHLHKAISEHFFSKYLLPLAQAGWWLVKDHYKDQSVSSIFEVWKEAFGWHPVKEFPLLFWQHSKDSPECHHEYANYWLARERTQTSSKKRHTRKVKGKSINNLKYHFYFFRPLKRKM